MSITLNFWEKCYLVALFGDLPMDARERLFSVSSFPAQAGPIVMRAGYEFIGHLDNGRIAVKQPKKRRSFTPKTRDHIFSLYHKGVSPESQHERDLDEARRSVFALCFPSQE